MLRQLHTRRHRDPRNLPAHRASDSIITELGTVAVELGDFLVPAVARVAEVGARYVDDVGGVETALEIVGWEELVAICEAASTEAEFPA